MTLRTFLQAHHDRRFLLQGQNASAQAVCNHYSFALDAQVEQRGNLLVFTSPKGPEIMYTACALLPE